MEPLTRRPSLDGAPSPLGRGIPLLLQIIQTLLEQHHAFGIDLNAATATAARYGIVDANHVIACVFESRVIVRIGPWRK
jgi:hypothetical protein